MGSPSADAPPVQFSLRARYEWYLNGGYTPFVQVGATHSGHSFTQAGSILTDCRERSYQNRQVAL